MRNLAPHLLAGLLAVSAVALLPTASALCADDGNGGCQAFQHDLPLDVVAECDEAAAICIVHPEDVDAVLVPSGGLLNLTVRNGLSVPLDFEVFVTGRFDDATSDTGDERLRADRIALLEDLQPGETRNQVIEVSGNVSALRLQALSDDGHQAELDAEATPIMTMTGGVVDEPRNVEDMPEESQSGVSDEDAKSRGSPFVPALWAIAILGAAAVVARVTRNK